MTNNGPEVQLSFEDERNRRTDEIIQRSEDMIAMINQLNIQPEGDETSLTDEPVFRVPPRAQENLDYRRRLYDRTWDIVTSKNPAGAVAVRHEVEKDGLRRDPPTGEEVDASEMERDEAVRIERRAAKESHASKAHTKVTKSKVLSRRYAKPRAGRGGDKDVPKSVAEIDGERIIR